MTKANRVHSTQRRTASKRKPLPTKKSPTTPPAGPPADPIFMAIEEHRQKLAAYTIIADRPGDIPRDAPIDEVWAAGHSLLTTRPTTLAGAIAVLRYVRSQHHESGEHEPTFLPLKIDGEVWAYAFLETIADALGSGLSKIVAVTGAVERWEA